MEALVVWPWTLWNAGGTSDVLWMLDVYFLTANRKRELGLDRRETGSFYPTVEFVPVIQILGKCGC